jgi:hypothetical protein
MTVEKALVFKRERYGNRMRTKDPFKTLFKLDFIKTEFGSQNLEGILYELQMNKWVENHYSLILNPEFGLLL